MEGGGGGAEEVGGGGGWGGGGRFRASQYNQKKNIFVPHVSRRRSMLPGLSVILCKVSHLKAEVYPPSLRINRSTVY